MVDHSWAANTLYCNYEPHEASLHNIHIMPTCLFDIFQASEEGKSATNYDTNFKIFWVRIFFGISSTENTPAPAY